MGKVKNSFQPKIMMWVQLWQQYIKVGTWATTDDQHQQVLTKASFFLVIYLWSWWRKEKLLQPPPFSKIIFLVGSSRGEIIACTLHAYHALYLYKNLTNINGGFNITSQFALCVIYIKAIQIIINYTFLTPISGDPIEYQ